jgi:uncharacterized membrane protein YraQ (UPF0718 family)
MIASFIIIYGLVLILSVVALRRSKETFMEAARIGLEQGRMLILRMPLAILVGAFLLELVPQEIVHLALGEQSGLQGILIASVVGAFLPGGPFLSFPIAVALYKAGVGAPQLMALLTAWSVYAVHRTLIFELPLMGARFVWLRLASSIMLPSLVGIIAALALTVVSIA